MVVQLLMYGCMIEASEDTLLEHTGTQGDKTDPISRPVSSHLRPSLPCSPCSHLFPQTIVRPAPPNPACHLPLALPPIAYPALPSCPVPLIFPPFRTLPSPRLPSPTHLPRKLSDVVQRLHDLGLKSLVHIAARLKGQLALHSHQGKKHQQGCVLKLMAEAQACPERMDVNLNSLCCEAYTGAKQCTPRGDQSCHNVCASLDLRGDHG